MMLAIAFACCVQATPEDIGRWLRDNGIIAMTSSGRSRPAVDSDAGTLEFDMAVEEWALAPVPADLSAMADRLGSDRYRDREAASRALERRFRDRPEEARWLFRMRQHRDLEVRVRADAILKRLNPCRTCKGDGISKNWPEYACSECNGTGRAWLRSIWGQGN